MNTTVGCAGCSGAGSALLSVENFEQATARRTTASKDKAVREAMEGTLAIILSLRGHANESFFRKPVYSVQLTLGKLAL
jgi:hypothetical protein